MKKFLKLMDKIFMILDRCQERIDFSINLKRKYEKKRFCWSANFSDDIKKSMNEHSSSIKKSTR